MSLDPNCPFCRIVIGEEPAIVLGQYPEAMVIVPHNPVVHGHVLVIPRRHARDFADKPMVSADVMSVAAQHVRVSREFELYDQCNLITSRGVDATQTVFHLHLHIVPRTAGDGLHLPWTGQEVAGAT